MMKCFIHTYNTVIRRLTRFEKKLSRKIEIGYLPIIV